MCPHYGYVVDGRLRIKYPDTGEEEIFQAGDAYYIPERHVFVIEEEVECVEFSPHDKLTECMTAINSNARKYGYPGAETVDQAYVMSRGSDETASQPLAKRTRRAHAD